LRDGYGNAALEPDSNVLPGALVDVTVLLCIAHDAAANRACDHRDVVPRAPTNETAEQASRCSADDGADPELVITLKFHRVDLYNSAEAH
jgi:hypothetical protein